MSTDVGELNRMFMRVGELAGSIDGLHKKMDYRAAAAEKQADFVATELRNVNRDLRELEKKQDESVAFFASEVALIKEAHELMVDALKELRAPVGELLALRARAAGALLVIGPIGASILYFVPEIWKSVWNAVEAWFRNRGS